LVFFMSESQRRFGGWFVPTLVVLFFVSGACGLVYQVLWLRLLGLVFGVTVYAASTVWASFMAGLGLGSVLGGLMADRASRPLVWFGAAEMLIGVSALATPGALEGLREAYATLYPSLPQSLAAVTLARAVIAFAVLLVPAALMGMTLPLVVRSSLFTGDELGSRVGLLYGANTAGAIVGTLAAGAYLVPTLGIFRTFLAAASANLVVGLSALAVAAVTGHAPGRGGPPSAVAMAASDGDRPIPDRVRHLVLVVFAVSGFATLALEVVWFRVITLIVRPTVYSFAGMLATVLLGIAVGSWLVTPLMRRNWNWVAILAVVEIVMSLAAVCSLVTLNQVPRLQHWLDPYLTALMPAYFSFVLLTCVPAILPTCLLMGVAFPIGLRLWAGGETATLRRAASRIGLFYSLNVCGAILGSLAAGFVLLPQLGSRRALVTVATLIFAAGMVLLLASPARRAWRLAGVVVSTAAFFTLSWRVADPFDAFLALRFPHDEIVWREEGVQATVSVHRRDGILRLHLEGNHQASDEGGMVSVHRRIGHLPLAVHPNPRRVLVIGLGGGATAGAVSLHEGVDVDVVELSRSVVRASEYFRHVNYDLLRRPNVRVLVDDGRNYLMLTRWRYDVITADIILPLYAGSNNVYAAEYFRLVRRALNPGGLALQWVAGTEAEYKTIMRTFLSVFPHTTLWADGSLMLGSLEPLRLRRGDVTWKLQLEGRREALAQLGVRSFEDLLGLYVAGPDELRRFVGSGPILTDDRPLVEYFLSLPRDREPDLSELRGDVRRHLVEP
jgi:spermidine synthase